MIEDDSHSPFIRRNEFEVLRQDVRTVERDLTRLDILVQQLYAQGQEQNMRLISISEMLQRQEDDLQMRDQAMRRVVWAANMLGPKSIALAVLLLSFAYEWLKRR